MDGGGRERDVKRRSDSSNAIMRELRKPRIAWHCMSGSPSENLPKRHIFGNLLTPFLQKFFTEHTRENDATHLLCAVALVHGQCHL
jgi:hypothetical protein